MVITHSRPIFNNVNAMHTIHKGPKYCFPIKLPSKTKNQIFEDYFRLNLILNNSSDGRMFTMDCTVSALVTKC